LHPEACSEIPSEPRELKIVSIRLFIRSSYWFEAVLKYKSLEECHWLNITSFVGLPLKDVSMHGKPAAGESFTPYASMVSQKGAIPGPAVSD
jgi:hypothetical protein